jgi:hypothetical protein
VGSEYLVLQPSDAADPFTVNLAAGTYTVEWYSVDTRKTEAAGEVTAEGTATVNFTAPFEPGSLAVLNLKQVGRRA